MKLCTALVKWASDRAAKSGLECYFEGMVNNADREIAKNVYFVTAWNEWNEQAVLEPDSIHKFGYLESLSTKLQEVPVSIVFLESDHKKNAGNRGEFLSQCKKMQGIGENSFRKAKQTYHNCISASK